MDVHLTGQIFGIPISLIGQATQDIKITDWLPLIAVFLTAIFTYFITATIQERNHQKELKRQAYFELIDVITKTRKVYDDNRHNPVQEDPEKQTAEDRERIEREMMIPYAFQAAKFKTYVVGSKEFNELIDTQLKEKDPVKNGNDLEYQRFMKSLIDQMTKELINQTFIKKANSWSRRLSGKALAGRGQREEKIMKKGWWQFWK
jgi:hypothetical protein